MDYRKTPSVTLDNESSGERSEFNVQPIKPRLLAIELASLYTWAMLIDVVVDQIVWNPIKYIPLKNQGQHCNVIILIYMLLIFMW